MKRLTIRGVEDDLRKHLECLAHERGLSLNKAALLLLRRGAGLDIEAHPPDVVGNALDAYVGTWTEEDERAFLRSTDPLEQVDRDLWK